MALKEWSVDLDSAHPLDTDPRLEAFADDLVDVLKAYHPAVAYDAVILGARIILRARSASEAIARAEKILTRAFSRIRFPASPDVIAAQAETVEELDRRLRQSNVPELMGVSEIAAALQVSRQRALEVSRRPDFPAPLAELAAGPVWDRHAVARFIERWPRRRTGRPKKAPVPA